MAEEFEDRLRQALRLRAAEVEPDPRLWERVNDRMRRSGRVTWTLAAAGAAMVAVLAVVVATNVLRPAEQVELAPADQPLEAPAPDAGGVQCPGGAQLVAVLQDAAGLKGACDNGETIAVAQGVAEPAFAPDGDRLAFSRPSDGAEGGLREVGVLDLGTGRETVVGPGDAPAFAPDGRLARAVPPETDDGAPMIVVTGEDGERLQAFPAQDEVRVPVRVAGLSWSADGRFLSYQVMVEESEGFLGVVAALGGERQVRTGSVLAHEREQGGQLVGTPVLDDTAMVTLWRCCATTEGAIFSQAELRLHGHGFAADDASRPFTSDHLLLADLAQIDGFDVNAEPSAFTVRPLGTASGERSDGRVRWTEGERPAFLVGDGSNLWLIETGDEPDASEVTLVAEDVVAAAVNPTAFPAAPLTGPRPPSETEPDATPPSETAPPPGPPTASPEPSPTPEEAEVQVYFPRPEVAEECETTWAFPRRVPVPALARGALEELLVGPTPEEVAQGAESVFGAGAADILLDVRLDADGTAFVDFADFRSSLPEVATACGSEAFLSQLDNTLMQFPTVRAARYMIEGDEETFYEFLQRSPPD